MEVNFCDCTFANDFQKKTLKTKATKTNFEKLVLINIKKFIGYHQSNKRCILNVRKYLQNF